LLRKEYYINSDELSDDDWWRLVKEQLYLRKAGGERFKNNLKEVLYELASRIYGNN